MGRKNRGNTFQAGNNQIAAKFALAAIIFSKSPGCGCGQPATLTLNLFLGGVRPNARKFPAHAGEHATAWVGFQSENVRRLHPEIVCPDGEFPADRSLG